jgi:hypothetical protein
MNEYETALYDSDDEGAWLGNGDVVEKLPEATARPGACVRFCFVARFLINVCSNTTKTNRTIGASCTR